MDFRKPQHVRWLSVAGAAVFGSGLILATCQEFSLLPKVLAICVLAWLTGHSLFMLPFSRTARGRARMLECAELVEEARRRANQWWRIP